MQSDRLQVVLGNYSFIATSWEHAVSVSHDTYILTFICVPVLLVIATWQTLVPIMLLCIESLPCPVCPFSVWSVGVTGHPVLSSVFSTFHCFPFPSRLLHHWMGWVCGWEPCFPSFCYTVLNDKVKQASMSYHWYTGIQQHGITFPLDQGATHRQWVTGKGFYRTNSARTQDSTWESAHINKFIAQGPTVFTVWATQYLLYRPDG